MVDGLRLGFLPAERVLDELFAGEKGIGMQNDPIPGTCSKRRGIPYYLGRREGNAVIFLQELYPLMSGHSPKVGAC